MNDPLSPSAVAVLDAFWRDLDFGDDFTSANIAAALEAAAAQVEPDDGVSSEVRRVLDRLLAIAAELLERPTPQLVAEGPKPEEILAFSARYDGPTLGFPAALRDFFARWLPANALPTPGPPMADQFPDATKKVLL